LDPGRRFGRATIQNLGRYKEIAAKLADPRKITDADAQALIKQGKILYWATAACIPARRARSRCSWSSPTAWRR